jgi:tetratricopeptide (TPR) repeat protein
MTNSRIDRSSVTWKPYFGIANVYLAMGDLETAYLYLIQALRECPNNPVVKQQYTDLRQLLKPIVGG